MSRATNLRVSCLRQNDLHKTQGLNNGYATENTNFRFPDCDPITDSSRDCQPFHQILDDKLSILELFVQDLCDTASSGRTIPRSDLAMD